MTDFALIMNISDFLESIHVKLANEGMEITVLKSFWKYFLAKLVHILNSKVIPCFIERNYFFINGILYN